jgi:hypothetical protein
LYRYTEGAAGVAGVAAEAETAGWSMWDADRPFQCILGLHQELDAARHPRHRRKTLAGVGVLLKLLGAAAMHPSTARHLCHVLLPHVGDAHLGPAAVGLLGRVALTPGCQIDYHDITILAVIK